MRLMCVRGGSRADRPSASCSLELPVAAKGGLV